MAKAGFPFQDLVAALEQALDPGATVTTSDWERDASGGLERDVRVIGTRSGEPWDLFAECKDWAKPVGPGVVLEVAGKRDFLGADEARVYANSRFTAKAAQVADRMKVGIFYVAADGDPRSKIDATSLLYRSVLAVENTRLELFPPDDGALTVSEGYSLFEPRLGGSRVADWMLRQIGELRHAIRSELDSRSMASGRIRLRLLLTPPTTMTVGFVDEVYKGAALDTRIVLRWEGHSVPMSMSLGQLDPQTGIAILPDKEWISYEIDPEANWEPTDPPPATDEGFNTFRLNFLVVRMPVAPGATALGPSPDLSGIGGGWDAWLLDEAGQQLCELQAATPLD